MMSLKEKIFLPIKAALYPKRCICCKAPIGEGESLCSFCKKHIERVNGKKRCIRCGREKESCECRSRAFYFSGVTAPFYNAGLARKTLYEFKLGNKPDYAEFFAEETAKAVKEAYNGVRLDCICYIPLSFRSRIKRGFNQSRLLAEHIGKILNIPVRGGIIRCRGGISAQHKLGLKERETAARLKYYSGGRVRGTVLLVDDIMTTGSTLNAGARVLLSSGAEKVYCAAALISKGKKKDEKALDGFKTSELVF